MDKNSTRYTVVFAATVCLICGIAVASAAVGLREQQETNQVIDKKSKVLVAAGLLPEGKASADDVTNLYEKHVVPRVVNLKSGDPVPSIDPATFDIKKATDDPATSVVAPPNPAKMARLPNNSIVYEIVKDGELQSIVLPVKGKGLWSTLYGYLALSSDTETIKGLIFYQHGETPGLGGEVDNPRWRALWVGRKPFDEEYNPIIQVVKGAAGTVSETPHQVDGLSGATITSRGVTDLLQFWLGPDCYGPALSKYRISRPSSGSALTQTTTQAPAPQGQ